MERVKLTIKDIFIDALEQLHIITDHGEISFDTNQSEIVLLDNIFTFQGYVYFLFDDEHSPEREKLMLQFYNITEDLPGEKKKRPRIRKAEGKKVTVYSTKAPNPMVLTPPDIEYNGKRYQPKIRVLE